MLKYSLLILSMISTSAFSKCLTDIYSAGLSFDSFSYNIENNDGKKLDIGSDAGAGFKLGHIRFCPETKREYYWYYQLRYFSLKDAKSDPALRNLEDDIYLNSIGLNTRFLVDPKKEYLIDLETREEYSPGSFSGGGFGLEDEKYLNLKTALGIRYYLMSNKQEDYTVSGKLGGMIPIGKGDAHIGYLTEVNLEYLRRLQKKYSIRADLYLSYYEQEVSDFRVSRLELGARANYIFRY